MNNKGINRILFQWYLLKVKTYAIVTIIVFCFGLLIVLPNITIGPTTTEEAYIESIGVTHGATGSGIFISCKLQSGEIVNVHLEHQLPLKRGNLVQLNVYKRLLGGYKYEFVKPLKKVEVIETVNQEELMGPELTSPSSIQ